MQNIIYCYRDVKYKQKLLRKYRIYLSFSYFWFCFPETFLQLPIASKHQYVTHHWSGLKIVVLFLAQLFFSMDQLPGQVHHTNTQTQIRRWHCLYQQHHKEKCSLKLRPQIHLCSYSLLCCS